MNKVLCTFSLFFALAVMSSAMEKPQGLESNKHTEARLEKLKKLGATEEQIEQLHQLTNQHRAEIESLKIKAESAKEALQHLRDNPDASEQALHQAIDARSETSAAVKKQMVSHRFHVQSIVGVDIANQLITKKRAHIKESRANKRQTSGL